MDSMDDLCSSVRDGVGFPYLGNTAGLIPDDVPIVTILRGMHALYFVSPCSFYSERSELIRLAGTTITQSIGQSPKGLGQWFRGLCALHFVSPCRLHSERSARLA